MSIIKVAACAIVAVSATSIVAGCRSKQQSSADSASGAIAPIDTNPAPSQSSPASATNIDTTIMSSTAGHDVCAMSAAAMDSMRKAMHRMTGNDSMYIGQMRASCPHTETAHNGKGHGYRKKK